MLTNKNLKPGMLAIFNPSRQIDERKYFKDYYTFSFKTDVSENIFKIDGSNNISTIKEGAILFLVEKNPSFPHVWVCFYKGKLGFFLNQYLRPLEKEIETTE